MDNIDQNFEREDVSASQEPVAAVKPFKKSRPREFRVSLSVSILCTLLACLFVFMGTFVTLSLQAERKINEAYARAGEYEKLLEVAEAYDKYYLYDVDFDQTADTLAGMYGLAAGDRFSSYYTTEKWEEALNVSKGNATGIGVYVVLNTDGNILVAHVMPNSPAERDGLMKGDIITAIDDKNVRALGFENAVDLVMGEVGTVVSFDVLRGSEQWEINVTRGKYDPQTVFAETVTVEDNLYGYIQITEFEGTTPTQFISAVEKLTEMGAKGFVFDLRDNPGGYVDSVIAILDYLLPEGPIMHIKGVNNNETINSDAQSIDLPMVVLVNGNTASAAEMFTSALKDYNKAEIVGVKTFGKGCGQEGFFLSDGSVIYITTFLYDPPFSENYNGIGIMPDHSIEIAREWVNTNILLIPHEEDNQLGKAIDVLHINVKQSH